MLQGQRDLAAVSQLILSELAPLVTAQHGVFYVVDAAGRRSRPSSCWPATPTRTASTSASEFRLGEGLVGQCALERRMLHRQPRCRSDYIQISSGLGEAPPRNIVVLPVLFEGEVKAVLELASFDQFNEIHLTFLDQLTESIGIVLNTIAANMRTEELLKQSQALTESLQSQQEELHRDQQAAGAADPLAAEVRGAAPEAAGRAADRPTRSWRRRPSCWPSRRRRWSRRTRRWSRPRWRWRRRPSSWP